MIPSVLFITGIDTDAGKTYATAFIAKRLAAQGKRVITQKFIQTGCVGTSEDILKHRELCGMPLTAEDTDGTTAPIIFTYPASAQLAARLDGREIDLHLVEQSTAKLLTKYDVVLIEGAGGLMVPITDHYATIDYIAEQHLPTILVTNGRLGSINHTILSLEAMERRSIEIAAIVYNTYFDYDTTIATDTLAYITRRMAETHPQCKVIVMPNINKVNSEK